MEEARDKKDQSGRRQLTIVGGTVAVLAVMLFLIWYLLLRTPFVPAFTGLQAADAATITGELDRLKTPYTLGDDGKTILVAEDQVDAARIDILGGELPLKGAVGFELFNKTDMGLTEFAQRINYLRALQGELARTIMSLEEVEAARVHLSLPESGIFEKDRRPAKASVTVTTRLGGSPDAAVVRGIQQLVASAVPELEAANVAVLDARGQILSAAPTQTLFQSPAIQERDALEALYAAKVRQAVEATGISVPMSVNVVALPTAPGISEQSITDGSGATQTAERRLSPLRVTMLFASEPSPAIRERILDAARKAVGGDPALGDVVEARIDPTIAAQGPAVPVPVQPMQRAAPPAVEVPIQFDAKWLAGLAAAVLGLLLLFALWRRNETRPLSEGERQSFSERLRELLDEEDANGRSPA